MKSLVIAFAWLASVSLASAGPTLSAGDVAQIKRICRHVFGAPAKDIESFLRPLARYMRDQRSLAPWVCSSQHCRGAVALRDDAQVVYGFMSIPDPSATDPMDITPDAVRKGNNRINAVGLVRGGKVLFAIPPSAAPFLTKTSSNQALERTADRRANLLSMTSTLKPKAQLALVSGRSAWSR